MKKTWLVKLLAGMSMLLALNGMPSIVAAADSASFAIYINEEKLQTGAMATIYLTGSNIRDLYAYEAALAYDPSILELIEAQPQLQGFSVSPRQVGTHSVIAFTKTGDSSGENGDVILHTITFKALVAGEAEIKLKSVETLNSQLTMHSTYSGNSVRLNIVGGSSGNGGEGGNIGERDNENVSGTNINDIRPHSLGRIIAYANKTTLELASEQMEEILQEEGDDIVIDLNAIDKKYATDLNIPVAVLNLVGEAGKELVIVSGDVRLVLSRESFHLAPLSGSITIVVKDIGSLGLPDDNWNAATNTFDITIRSEEQEVAVIRPVKVTFALGEVGDSRKAGVYYYNEVIREWEFVGGQVSEDKQFITFAAQHFSRYAVFVYNKSFHDVPAIHWADDAIGVLAAKHIVHGVDADYFAPERSITRAEVAAMSLRLLELPKIAYKGEFTDVPEDAWYADAIATTNQAGIMLGDGALMRPHNSITRQEIAAVAMRIYAKLGMSKDGGQPADAAFADVANIAPWAKETVKGAWQAGIMNVKPGKRFAPLEHTTRAEAATIFYRLLDKGGRL